MSYASTIRDISNPVDVMLFRRPSNRDIQRAIDLGREEARLERVANADADLEKYAALGNRLAREAASRPTAAKASPPAPDPSGPKG